MLPQILYWSDDWTSFFFREALNPNYPIYGDQGAGVWGFLSCISIVIFSAEQVYLMLHVTNH